MAARAANVSHQLRLAGYVLRVGSRDCQGVQVSQVGDDVRIQFHHYGSEQREDLAQSITELLCGKDYEVRPGTLVLWVRRPA